MHYIIKFVMKKLLKLSIIALMLSTSAFAGTDGENELSKKAKSTKDCFEPLNRATFALNQGLDKVVFKPVAKIYRVLPTPVRAGTSNAIDNLSTLVTIPNNLLQGDFKSAGINTGRFLVNTTFGIIGLIDVAQMIGFPEYEKEDYGQTLGALGSWTRVLFSASCNWTINSKRYYWIISKCSWGRSLVQCNCCK